MSIQIQKRRPSYLRTSLKLDGLVEIISIVRESPKYLAEIQRNSRICMKGTTTKYVKYCSDKGFFDSYFIPRRGHGSRFEKNKTKNKYYRYYRITDKGSKFLEILS